MGKGARYVRLNGVQPLSDSAKNRYKLLIDEKPLIAPMEGVTEALLNRLRPQREGQEERWTICPSKEGRIGKMGRNG